MLKKDPSPREVWGSQDEKLEFCVPAYTVQKSRGGNQNVGLATREERERGEPRSPANCPKERSLPAARVARPGHQGRKNRRGHSFLGGGGGGGGGGAKAEKLFAGRKKKAARERLSSWQKKRSLQSEGN